MLAAATTTPATNELDFALDALRTMWPLLALVAVVYAGKLARHAWKMRRLRRAGIFEIDAMNCPMFEQRLAVLFRSLGYRAEAVGRSGDYGADLVIAKDGKRSVVQAKCWKQNVGLTAVQEVHGARSYYDADAALVVTNARFTKPARELARKTDVTLWGRDELIVALLKTHKARRKSSSRERHAVPEVKFAPPAPPLSTLGLAPEAEQTPTAVVDAADPFCARCGNAVSEKVRDYCLAHPKRFKGLVYCFEDQRTFKRTR